MAMKLYFDKIIGDIVTPYEEGSTNIPNRKVELKNSPLFCTSTVCKLLQLLKCFAFSDTIKKDNIF